MEMMRCDQLDKAIMVYFLFISSSSYSYCSPAATGIVALSGYCNFIRPFCLCFFFFVKIHAGNMEIYNNSNNNENKQTSRYNFNEWKLFFFFFFIFNYFHCNLLPLPAIREAYLVLLLASISLSIEYKFLVFLHRHIVACL